MKLIALVFASLALVASTGCAGHSLKPPIKPLCYQYGDWEGDFVFLPNGELSVTIFDNYLISSDQFQGTWSLSGDKVKVAWAGTSEEYAFDAARGQAIPPSDSNKCPSDETSSSPVGA